MPRRKWLTTRWIGTMGGGEVTDTTTYLFDQGSFSAFVEESTGVYRITPKKHWDTKWAWWCLRSGRFGGTTPHFLIAKADHFSMNANEWLACWSTSLDSDTWTNFDNVSIGASDLEFYHNTAFPSGMIYIAAMPAYSFSRTERKIAEWSASALVGETISTTNLILGNSTSRDNGDGRTAPALPFYGMKISNGAGTKNNGILVARNHPSENIGGYMLEGAIDWLLTTSAKQGFLLDYFNFFVYPCLNPQGVQGGWFRSSRETPTQDNNRLWDGTGVNEAVDAFKAAWTADFADVIEAGFDFHSWMAADGNKGLTGDSTVTLWTAFIAAMQSLDATFVMRADDTTASMSANYWRSLNSGKLVGFIDHGGVTTLGPSDWKLVGQRTMISLADMLAAGYFTNNPGVGHRSFNGTTDRIDRANVADLSGHALTISAWVYLDAVTHSSYVLCNHNSGNTQYGIVFTVAGDTAISFLRRGTTDYLWAALNSGVDFDSPSAWHHILTTSDGGLLSGSVANYIDGVSKTISFTNGSGAETSHTGSWSIGGRIYDDARNLDGKIAQVRVFDRVLTADEIALEAVGVLTTTSGLVSWLKGNTASLTDAVDSVDWTADGTSQVTGVGNGPSIVYPTEGL